MQKSRQAGIRKPCGGVRQKELAHPFHPRPARDSRHSASARVRAEPPRRARRQRQSGEDASCRRRAIHVFRDRHPAFAGRSSRPSCLGCPTGKRAFTTRARFGPLSRSYRSAFSSETARRARDLWHPVTGLRATPPFRRRTAPATGLDRFRDEPREQPGLPRSGIPSAVGEPEGPLRPLSAFARGSRAQRPFTRRGSCHLGLSSAHSPQPQPRGTRSSETLPDDFCNHREGRAHPAKRSKPRTALRFSRTAAARSGRERRSTGFTRLALRKRLLADR